MAKRATRKAEDSDEEAAEGRQHVIKLRLTPDELQTIRVAAAIEHMRPGQFVRSAVLDKAHTVEQEYLKRRQKK